MNYSLEFAPDPQEPNVLYVNISGLVKFPSYEPKCIGELAVNIVDVTETEFNPYDAYSLSYAMMKQMQEAAEKCARKLRKLPC